MQTLGVYGDSFAAVPDWAKDKTVYWSSLLGKKYSVFNYAFVGSDVYYSYSIFKDTYHLYDKAVFVITSPYRFFNCVLELETTDGKKIKQGVLSINIIDHILKQYDLSVASLLKLEALKQYYMYITDYSTQVDICKLMLKDIKSKKPDTVIICGGDRNIARDLTYPGDISFEDYQRLFWRSMDKKDEKFNEIGEWYGKEKNCPNHLSEEVSALVAQHIKEALEKGIWNPVLPNTLPHYHGWDYYYDI
jgi:hypothetical protein